MFIHPRIYEVSSNLAPHPIHFTGPNIPTCVVDDFEVIYSSLLYRFDLRSLSYLSKRMWPRNKMNPRQRKKMSPREFLSANLSINRSKVGIGEFGKKVKNMDVCVILCFIIDFFFFRKFSVYFGNFVSLIYILLKLLCETIMLVPQVYHMCAIGLSSFK